AVVGLGVLEAAFSKLPLTLVSTLMSALIGKDAPAPAQGMHHSDRFYGWFSHFADDVATWLHVDFGVKGMIIILACAVVAIACGLLGGVCIYGVQIVSRYFAIKIVADLRHEVARHILALPLRFFGNRRMGELMSKLTNDAQVLQRSF